MIRVQQKQTHHSISSGGDLLETQDNPFAWIVLAHLKSLETRNDATARRVWKFRLVRTL